MNNKTILFITYFFNLTDGVASTRSRSLANFLEQRGFRLIILNSKTWNKYIYKNNLIWGIRCSLFILKNRSIFKKVYISCGPFLHLIPIVFTLSFLKKPFIIDFRDPWSPNIATNYGKINRKIPLKNKIKLVISRFIEKILYRKCQYFLVCTEGMMQEYSKLFNNNKKIRLITNGYDFNPEDFKKFKNTKSDTTKYVCLGKFAEYGEDKAIYCLEKIKEKHKESGSDFCIHIVGAESIKTKELIKKLNLEENIKYYERLPYNLALKIAASADFGLTIIRNEKLEYGTKIFDYIGLGLPVFDIFEIDSNFRKFFMDYITTDKNTYDVSNEKVEKFHRFEIFSKNIDIFEENIYENSIFSRA